MTVPSRPLLWRASLIVASAVALLLPCRAGLGWGHEGHTVVALVAEHYMTGVVPTKARDLLGGGTIDAVASWADDYRRDHPETGPWHYIDAPLADSRIDLAREYLNESAVRESSGQPAILRSRRRSRALRSDAMKNLDSSRLFLQRPGYPCQTVM
jgi:nuclease S1